MDASEALQRLLAAATAGDWLNLTDAGDRDVPAEALYAALVDDAPPHPRALRIQGARIVGALDLEAATLRCPLHLVDCDVADPITLSEATAPAIRLIRCRLGALIAPQLHTRGNLELTASTITGPAMLEGAHIGGQLHFSGAQLSNEHGPALNADGLVVDQNMYCGVDGEQRFTASGAVRLVGAHIAGDFNFSGARLSNPNGRALDGDRLVVDQNMYCAVDGEHRFTASGAVRLLAAHIGGQLHFNGAQLSNAYGPALSADGLVVDQDMLCRVVGNDRFTATGEVRLAAAHIAGQLIFHGAQLSNEHGLALTAHGLVVDQHMLCRVVGEDRFTTTGGVGLLGARIGGQLDLSGAQMSNENGPALNADGLVVAQNMYCEVEGGHPFTANSEVRMLGAHIGGQLDFSGAQLSSGAHSSNQTGLALNADRLVVDRDMFCDSGGEQRFTATGGVGLPGARVGGLLQFQQADVSSERGPAVTLFESDVGWLRVRFVPRPNDGMDLRRARVATITVGTTVEDATWPSARLAGCRVREAGERAAESGRRPPPLA